MTAKAFFAGIGQLLAERHPEMGDASEILSASTLFHSLGFTANFVVEGHRGVVYTYPVGTQWGFDRNLIADIITSAYEPFEQMERLHAELEGLRSADSPLVIDFEFPLEEPESDVEFTDSDAVEYTMTEVYEDDGYDSEFEGNADASYNDDDEVDNDADGTYYEYSSDDDDDDDMYEDNELYTHGGVYGAPNAVYGRHSRYADFSDDEDDYYDSRFGDSYDDWDIDVQRVRQGRF
jgi:hypothetical protein